MNHLKLNIDIEEGPVDIEEASVILVYHHRNGGKPAGKMVSVREFLAEIEAAVNKRLEAMGADVSKALADPNRPIYVINEPPGA